MRAVPLLLSAVTLLALTACGSGAGQSSAAPTTPEDQPTQTATPTPDPTPTSPPETSPPDSTPPPTAEAMETPQGAETVTAYFVRSASDRLWVEPAEMDLDEPTVGVAQAAVQAMLTGDPRDPGLAPPADTDAQVLGADIDDGLLTVNVSAALAQASGGSAAEEALAQALAHTGAQFDSVDSVQLWIEGEAVTDLWGHLDWSDPVEPDLFALSPIVISSPEWDAEVSAGTLTASGTANVFEATVGLRLVDPVGTVVEDTFTTATCGSGCRGDWEHTFDTELTPGSWTVEAEEPDPSGGEGRAPFVASVEFEVR